MTMASDSIPAELRERDQWVAYNMPGKCPMNPHTGNAAKCNDPKTWGSYDAAVALAERRGWTGVGYQFSEDDQFAGVDLDNCRVPETGEIAPEGHRQRASRQGSPTRHATADHQDRGKCARQHHQPRLGRGRHARYRRNGQGR